MNDDYQAREPFLQRYYQVTKNLTLHFDVANIVHVPRIENDRADVLPKLATTKKIGQHKTLMQEVLYAPSWNLEDVFEIHNEGDNWMTHILNFLIHNTLPENEAETELVSASTAGIEENDQSGKKGVSPYPWDDSKV